MYIFTYIFIFIIYIQICMYMYTCSEFGNLGWSFRFKFADSSLNVRFTVQQIFHYRYWKALIKIIQV